MSATRTRPVPPKAANLFSTLCTVVATLFLTLDAAAQQAPDLDSTGSLSTYALIFTGCLFLFLAWCVGTLRWKWILEASGLHLNYGFLLQTWVAADFLNRLLPFVLPMPPLGAAYRFAQTARLSREPSRSAVVIALEKVCGLFSFALLFALLFPLALLHLELDLARLSRREEKRSHQPQDSRRQRRTRPRDAAQF